MVNCLPLSRRRPTVVNYIMGVVPIPANFDKVKKIRFTAGKIILRSESGQKVDHVVDETFLQTRR